MRRRVITIAILVVVAAAGLSLLTRRAEAQFVNTDKLRFQMLSEEAILGPDGRAVVQGWRALQLRDRAADLCYTAFITGTVIVLTDPVQCP